MSVVGERLQPTLFELSRPGRGGGKIPHPPADALHRLPATALRATPPALPELSEPEVVRHYVNLSALNYSVDTGFYPLGSCTMKFNPKLNEWAARLPGFAGLHPMAPDATAQGTLQLLYELEGILTEISGMDAVTLQPAAGAQGELTGILMIRAYHRSRGDLERTEVLVPDSSHGTNPATASMAGFRTITIPSAADGGVDLDAFRAALGPRTAAIMITNPSTLGLFESRVGELLEATHAAGALAYMDGANLNAILGRFRPGSAGFDVMHFNTHKTFSTPHGGGGPWRGPGGRSRGPHAVPARATGPARGRRVLPPGAGGGANHLHRPRALVLRQHGRARPRLRLPARPRRQRPGRGERRRGPRRQLPQGARRRCVPGAVRPAVHARVRGLGRGPQAPHRGPDPRRRQAADRQGVPPPDRSTSRSRSRRRC